jgi:hypothetical protein
MPYALAAAEQRGTVEVEAHGQRHIIEFAVDHIRQEPVIRRNVEQCDRQIGTSIRVHWPVSPRSNLDNAKVRFLQIADDFTWLNPHLTLTIDWRGDRRPAGDDAGSARVAEQPTSPHWYEIEHLQRLAGAYIKADEDAAGPEDSPRVHLRFRGLTGTGKQKAVPKPQALQWCPHQTGGWRQIRCALVASFSRHEGELQAMKSNSSAHETAPARASRPTAAP